MIEKKTIVMTQNIRFNLGFLANKYKTSGSFIATGDQGLFNETSIAWDGLESAPSVGNKYAVEAVYGAGASWTVLVADRGMVGGSYYLPEAGTAGTLKAFLKGGTNAMKLRALLYGTNATANNQTSTDYITDGARPNARIAVSPTETNIAASAGAAVVSLPMPATALTAGNHWIGLWAENVATGASIFNINDVVVGRLRTNSGAMNYSPSADPLAILTGTASASTEYCWWLEYTPVAPTAPGTPTLTVTGIRSIDVIWTGNDVRTSRYRVERRKNAGSWVNVAVVGGTSYADSDLQSGATYDYRIFACYKNTASVASALATAVAGGVRLATLSATYTLLADTVRIDNSERGVQGNQRSAVDAVQTEEYFRGFEWVELETSENVYNFSSIESSLTTWATAGKRGHIRGRASVPGVLNTLPAYIKATGNFVTIGSGEYPDYRNAYIRGRMVALITALGVAFGTDTRLTMLDMGWIGQYGEWSGEQGYTFAFADLTPIIDAMCTAFAAKKLLMSIASNEAVTAYALAKTNVVGIRFDSLGDTDNPSGFQRVRGQRTLANRAIIDDPRSMVLAEHKTAWTTNTTNWTLSRDDVAALNMGVVGDANLTNYASVGAGNQALLQESFRTAGYRFVVTASQAPTQLVRNQAHKIVVFWRNIGNRALIESWPAEIQLRSGITKIWSMVSSVNLINLLPSSGSLQVTDSIIVPTNIAVGTYTLGVQIPPLNSRTPSIALHNSGVQTGTWYSLGSVIVS